MRVGIDIGGTFTDLVVERDGTVDVAKVPSTPDDPARGFLEALRRADGDPDELRHGTTVATNAVLTRTGARVAFLGTEGFRHLLHLARQTRPSLYDLKAAPPVPLVDRELCVGVAERIGPRGEVIRELDEAALRRAVESIAGRVDAVAVALLHSYADPTHERRVGELLAAAVPDVPVSLSSDVVPEIREYERASTTTLNAYVQPVLSRYLRRIDGAVPGARVGVMWSGGGVRGIARSADRPVHTLLSGPAAGVLGAAWAAERCGFADVVSLDMGGTSADVAIVDGGRPLAAEEASLDGLPFRTPCLDVISVGAGGGSIGWLDSGGALRAGPASAGADPGPACYGLGGTDATVTDAHLVLGHLGAEGLAGGELALDPDAARAAVERLGRRAGLDAADSARGILQVVRATMARAIRSVSIERGRDVRDYALVAFGGAGPLQGAELAAELGIRRVVVPPVPGALAALGLLVASRRAEASVSHPIPADPRRDGEMRSVLHELTEQVLAELAEEGVDYPEARIELAADLRYDGQSHELRLAVDGRPSFAALTGAFHEAHRGRYGFARTEVPVEAVTFRASATGPPEEVRTAAPASGRMEAAGHREVEGVRVAVHERGGLPAEARLPGPAMVTETDSTVWVPPGWTAVVHPSGALVMEA